MSFDVAVVKLLFFSWLLIRFRVVSADTQLHCPIIKADERDDVSCLRNKCAFLSGSHEYLFWLINHELFNGKRPLTDCVSIYIFAFLLLILFECLSSYLNFCLLKHLFLNHLFMSS